MLSLIKKTAALRLISVYFVFICLIEPFGVCSYVVYATICKLEHKTTTFKVWMCHLICGTPVFLIGLALGIDLYLAQDSNI
jgi:hypothetical protein